MGSPSMPEKQAVVGAVSTHWPTRRSTCFASSLLDTANSKIATPGRPSGVSSGASSRSIPASQPHAITDVAKPVAVCAACSAHLLSSAVMTIARGPHAEGFGESIVDGHAVDDHVRPAQG